jgi:hypothetical protein
MRFRELIGEKNADWNIKRRYHYGAILVPNVFYFLSFVRYRTT